jgi:hypothetical protein
MVRSATALFPMCVLILSMSRVLAQDAAPPAWIEQALKAKPFLLEMRISGNRGARVNHALFAPAWTPGPEVEQELWVYGGSAWNRVAKAGQIAKKIQLHLEPSMLPLDLVADEFQIIAPVRLARLRAVQDGSAEELLNIALRPKVEPSRMFEPDQEYRRLLALPPDWEIRVFAYPAGSIHANSHIDAYYTKSHKGDTIDGNSLRALPIDAHR